MTRPRIKYVDDVPQILQRWWLDPESEVPVLTARGLDMLSDGKEYVADVETPIGHVQRHLCRVHCLHTSRPFDALADVITGSLYVGGRCLSGPLRIVGTPRKTGRKVPSMRARNNNAKARSVDHYVVTGVTDDA